MKNLSIVFVFVLLAFSLMAADFSGTWALNSDKSELGEGGRGRMAASKMVVTQTDKDIKIESTSQGRDGEERVRVEELTLDGKEQKTSNDRGETVSSAKLEDGKLVVTTMRKMERNGETFESTTNQTWELKSETELVVAVKSSSSRGEREMKLVYEKK